MNYIFAFLYKLWGWKIIGELPPGLKKAVIAVCPHQKTRDFLVGVGTRAVIKRKIGYLGKAELFKPPFGFIFRKLGGIPVYRSERLNLVESMIEAINREEDALVSLAPEGTRKNVSKLKSGFYYIAMGAKIPIIMVGFDIPAKQVVIAEPFEPSGDFKADMKKYFLPFYENIGGPKKDWFYNYKQGNFDG